jgi:Rho-binding antiterminator
MFLGLSVTVKVAKMEEEKYTPIACKFYDVLELYASRKEAIDITYFESPQKVKTIKSIIKDLVTRDKKEYLVLPDNTAVRLDQIISAGDTQFYGACGF